MKFKITDVTTEKIDVEYEDGITAEIPTYVGKDKVYYAKEIKASHTVDVEIPISDIPYKKGDEGTVGDDIPVEETIYSYKDVREKCYPTFFDIVNANYLARQGDTSAQTAVDEHIKVVNDDIPANNTKYTEEQAESKFTELQKNSAFIQR